MNFKPLGRSGVKVSELCYGTMSFGGDADEAASAAMYKACREAGFVPDAPHEADNLQMVFGMVAAGSGVALVPAFARKMKPQRVAFASLHPSPPNLETAIVWRRENTSPIVAEFIGIARRVLSGSQKGVRA